MQTTFDRIFSRILAQSRLSAPWSKSAFLANFVANFSKKTFASSFFVEKYSPKQKFLRETTSYCELHVHFSNFIFNQVCHLQLQYIYIRNASKIEKKIREIDFTKKICEINFALNNC